MQRASMSRVNRRSFAKLLAAAPLLRADDSTPVEIGGATINVSISGEFDLSHDAIVDWVRMAAKSVTAYFGRFPVTQAAVHVSQARRGRGVSNGRSFGEGGAHCRISVGQHCNADDLKRDWMLTHEMVHWGFPNVAEEHHWIEEGSATYIEPIARAKIGWLKPDQVWGDMIRDMWQGLPEYGDEGLDRTHTWGRTYWGGAVFCLMADIEIRKRTHNAKGLEHAMRAINRAGGTIEHDWPLTKAFEVGDKATGTKALMDTYAQMSNKPAAINLADLWNQLGVRRDGDVATFDKNAPLAAIRSGIC
jgi:hypothetical protein